MDRKKILFIDDEPSVLRGLQRALYSQRKIWDMQFVDKPREAVELARQIEFDAVVTDMKMPGMDGAKLLEQIAQITPNTFRLILSGHSDEDMIIRATANAHQFITKPCDPGVLRSTLERLFMVQDMLGNSKIIRFMSGIDQLPSLPDIYVRIQKAVQSEGSSITDIADIITQDLAMTAKVLQLVNSAFFGLGRHITDTREAVKLIGIDALKALVLSIGVFHKFDSKQVSDPQFDYIQLLDHSMATATLAASISKMEGGDKKMTDDSFISGLLHDLGHLILEENFSSSVVEVRNLVEQQEMSRHEAEEAVFGTTHGPVGAYLLGIWGLPCEVVEAVACHHTPASSGSDQFGPLAATHVADLLAHHSGQTDGRQGAEAMKLDEAFLQRIGKADRISDWFGLIKKGDHD